jgi:hypothetical protein
VGHANQMSTGMLGQRHPAGQSPTKSTGKSTPTSAAAARRRSRVSCETFGNGGWMWMTCEMVWNMNKSEGKLCTWWVDAKWYAIWLCLINGNFRTLN